MNLVVVGDVARRIPELDDDVEQVYLVETRRLSTATWAAENAASVSLVTADAEAVDDDVLLAVNDVEVTADPLSHVLSVTCDEDVVLMDWDESDAKYLALQKFLGIGAAVLDAADDFRSMEIGPTPDMNHMIDHLTRRITADVLRTIRAEIADTLTSRRYRSAAKRA